MATKKWYHSKVLWVNMIAFIASIVQAKFGFIIDPTLQGVLLTISNIVLRAITDCGIEGIEEKIKKDG